MRISCTILLILALTSCGLISGQQGPMTEDDARALAKEFFKEEYSLFAPIIRNDGKGTYMGEEFSRLFRTGVRVYSDFDNNGERIPNEYASEVETLFPKTGLLFEDKPSFRNMKVNLVEGQGYYSVTLPYVRKMFNGVREDGTAGELETPRTIKLEMILSVNESSKKVFIDRIQEVEQTTYFMIGPSLNLGSSFFSSNPFSEESALTASQARSTSFTFVGRFFFSPFGKSSALRQKGALLFTGLDYNIMNLAVDFEGDATWSSTMFNVSGSDANVISSDIEQALPVTYTFNDLQEKLKIQAISIPLGIALPMNSRADRTFFIDLGLNSRFMLSANSTLEGQAGIAPVSVSSELTSNGLYERDVTADVIASADCEDVSYLQCVDGTNLSEFDWDTQMSFGALIQPRMAFPMTDKMDLSVGLAVELPLSAFYSNGGAREVFSERGLGALDNSASPLQLYNSKLSIASAAINLALLFH